MLHINAGDDRSSAHPHATVSEARACEAEYRFQDAEARSEYEAEAAWLRAAESGSYAGSYEDGRDRFLDSLAGR